MLGILAIILLVLWATGNLAFHITEGFIHLLLAAALVLAVIWLYQRVRSNQNRL
jgi:flagellar biogenesis protein FliO